MDLEFNKQCVTEHNRKRAIHGCPPLELDQDLAKAAQEYAGTLRDTKSLKHASGDFGENLGFKMSSAGIHLTGADATEAWYSEIAKHRYGNNFQSDSGHFTQVVWKATEKAGFGVAYDKDKKAVYYVGRYSPPGNFPGRFQENVPKPR